MKSFGMFDRVSFIESRVERLEAIILAQDETIRALEAAIGARKSVPVNAEPIKRRMAQIAIEVAADNGLTLAELRGRSRAFSVSHPRQFAMLLMFQAGHSGNSIARFFNMDHTTVAHGVKAAKLRLKAMENPVDNAKGIAPVLQMVVNHG